MRALPRLAQKHGPYDAMDGRRVGPERQYRQRLTTAGYAPADIVDGDRRSLLFPPQRESAGRRPPGRPLRRRGGCEGASFSVQAGQVFGLLGPNGAGKTSILRVLTTLVRPVGGKAWILGHDVAAEPAAVRRLIGYVPQALSADGSLTGRENVSLFARLYAVPRHERRGRIDELLDLMDLGAAADRVVRTYSGRDGAAAGDRLLPHPPPPAPPAG